MNLKELQRTTPKLFFRASPKRCVRAQQGFQVPTLTNQGVPERAPRVPGDRRRRGPASVAAVAGAAAASDQNPQCSPGTTVVAAVMTLGRTGVAGGSKGTAGNGETACRGGSAEWAPSAGDGSDGQGGGDCTVAGTAAATPAPVATSAALRPSCSRNHPPGETRESMCTTFQESNETSVMDVIHRTRCIVLRAAMCKVVDAEDLVLNFSRLLFPLANSEKN